MYRVEELVNGSEMPGSESGGGTARLSAAALVLLLLLAGAVSGAATMDRSRMTIDQPDNRLVLGLDLCSVSTVDATLTSPADEATVSGTHTITWDTSGSAVSTDAGLWYYRAGDGWNKIAEQIADDGSYSWDTTGLTDGYYWIYVWVRDTVTDCYDFDWNDKAFVVDNTAPSVEIVEPDQGDVWNGTETIRWATEDILPDTVKIEQSGDGGSSWSTIVASTADDGSYDWDAGTVSAGTNYKVKVTATDTLGRTGSVTSSTFHVDRSKPSTTIQDPSAGGVIGGTHALGWSTSDTHPHAVELEYSDDDGATWQDLDVAAPEDGFSLDKVGVGTDENNRDDWELPTNAWVDDIVVDGTTYSFDSSADGFQTETDRTHSDVSWDSGNGRIDLHVDRRDTKDELFTRSLPSTWTGDTSWTVTSRWKATDQGNWQTAYPIFLSQSGTSTDLVEQPNAIHVWYRARDKLAGEDPQYRLRYRDGNGVLRIDEAYTGTADTEYRFHVDFDATTDTLTMEIRDSGGSTLDSASYQIDPAKTDDDGAWSWDTTTVDDDTDYKFRVRPHDEADLVGSWATSGTFAVDNTAPSVDVTDPSGIVAGDATITWSTTDPHDDTVTITYTGDSSGTIASGIADDGSHTWDTTAVDDGDYTIHVEAKDEAGNTGSGASDTVTVDNLAPSPTLTAPGGDDVLGDTTEITWTLAADDLTDLTLRYSTDEGSTWTDVATGVANDGSYSWDTSALAEGTTVRVRIRATDVSSNVGTDTGADAVVDHTSPDVSWTAPDDGATLSGGVEVTWSTSDAHADLVDLQTRIPDTTAWSTVVDDATDDGALTWDTTTVDDGTYEVRLAATDEAANVGHTKVRTLVVDNDAPTITMDNPTDGERFEEGETVEGTASDPGVGLETVEVRLLDETGRSWDADAGAWTDETTWIEASGTASWEIDMPSLEDEDDYRVTARATDGLDRTTTTAERRFQFVDIAAVEDSGGSSDTSDDTDASDGDATGAETTSSETDDDGGSADGSPDGPSDEEETVVTVAAGSSATTIVQPARRTQVAFQSGATVDTLSLRLGADVRSLDVAVLPSAGSGSCPELDTAGYVVYDRFHLHVAGPGPVDLTGTSLRVRVDPVFVDGLGVRSETATIFHCDGQAWEEIPASPSGIHGGVYTYEAEMDGFSPIVVAFRLPGTPTDAPAEDADDPAADSGDDASATSLREDPLSRPLETLRTHPVAALGLIAFAVAAAVLVVAALGGGMRGRLHDPGSHRR